MRLLLSCIHHIKSDLINNMDHMRISGTEPSSVILSQKSSFKKWKGMSKSCKVIKRYGVNRITDRHTVGRKDEVTLYMLLIKYFGHIKMFIYVQMTRYISFTSMQNKTTCMNQNVNLWSLKSKELNVEFFFFGLHLFAIFSGNYLWQLFHLFVSMSNIPTIQSTYKWKVYKSSTLQSWATHHNYGQSWPWPLTS